MSLFLHITVTFIKENIITKLQKLYNLHRNPKAGKIARASCEKNLFALVNYRTSAKYSLKGLTKALYFEI